MDKCAKLLKRKNKTEQTADLKHRKGANRREGRRKAKPISQQRLPFTPVHIYLYTSSDENTTLVEKDNVHSKLRVKHAFGI